MPVLGLGQYFLGGYFRQDQASDVLNTVHGAEVFEALRRDLGCFVSTSRINVELGFVDSEMRSTLHKTHFGFSTPLLIMGVNPYFKYSSEFLGFLSILRIDMIVFIPQK